MAWTGSIAMRLAVIIPNLHSPVIDEVITTVLAQAGAVDDLEVWVVGQDRYGKIPAHPRVHVLVTPEPVYPGVARNLGAAQTTTADALIFLDADCVPQPGWLTALVEAWQTHPEVGAVSGAMLPQSDSFMQHCGQIANFHEFLDLHPPAFRSTLASFSLLVSRIAWERSGGFDASLRHTEDMDFTLRLRKQGWILWFEARARVYHRPTRVTWRQFWRYARRGGYFSIQMRQRHVEAYRMPFWARWAWAWRWGAPFIATLRTLQIYVNTPGLWRYGYCLPWVWLHKVAWCWGAADGVAKNLNHGT